MKTLFCKGILLFFHVHVIPNGKVLGFVDVRVHFPPPEINLFSLSIQMPSKAYFGTSMC